MAAGDQPGPAPEAGGKGIPLWVLIGGAVVVGGFLWYRSRSGGAGASTNTSALQPGVATDPNTGLPIDPLTGLPYITGTGTTPLTNDTWATAAEAWAIKNGISAALANKSIYDYLNGNSLSTQESDILNKILSGFGFPPTILPFFGNPSAPKTTPTPPPPTQNGTTSTPKPNGHPVLPKINPASFPRFISGILHAPLYKIPPGGDVVNGAPVYALVNTGYGPVYEQGAAVNTAIKTRQPVYTLPQFKTYVHVPATAR